MSFQTTGLPALRERASKLETRPSMLVRLQLTSASFFSFSNAVVAGSQHWGARSTLLLDPDFDCEFYIMPRLRYFQIRRAAKPTPTFFTG